MAEEFFSFEDVLKELKMSEDELKRLVSEGEIRAFRDEDSMKFKKEDVDKLRSTGAAAGTESEISFEAEETGEEETLADELVFDDEEGLGLDDEEAGMATAQIASQDTIIDEEGDELSLEEEESLEVERPSRRGGRTRGRGSSRRGKGSRVSSKKGRITRASGRGTRLRELDEARKASSPLLIGILILTGALMIYAVMVTFSAAESRVTGLANPVASFMKDQLFPK